MTKLERIERDIASLAPDQLARLREWFAEFEAANWDTQFETDAASGKLDALAERAFVARNSGRTRTL